MNKQNKISDLDESISYAMAYAPNRFPEEDFLPSGDQMNLDRIFSRMRDQLAALAMEHGQCEEVNECIKGINNSYAFYKEGNEDKGFLELQSVLHTLLSMKKERGQVS